MKLVVLFRFVLFATLMGLASNIVVGQRASELQEAQSQLLEERLAGIGKLRLIQSEFDALQTLVAAYVVSKNSRHLVNYYELLDTHAGLRRYAEPVDNVYWSNLIAGRVNPVALLPGNWETLEERLALPEVVMRNSAPDLNEATQQVLTLSRQLRQREQIIFALTQGLYDPEENRFVSEAPVRDDLAIQMLFSEEHLGLSNAIRAQIQSRIGWVEAGYQTALEQQTQIIETTAQMDFYVGLLITALVLLGLAVIQRYVLKPLHELNNISKQIAKGHYDLAMPRPRYINEIINLVRGFQLMIGAFRRELEQGEAARAAQLAALEAKMGRERAEAQAQARGMLLANMSHEIRTPMNAILGMTALTLKSNLPERERGHLLKVQDAARSLLGLLNDVLDLSKAEAGMVELEHIPFTLDEVLANSFLAVQSQAASHNLLLLNQMAEGYTALLGQGLVGDPSRLRQVLTNLLSNAVKFTELGSVRVYSQLQTHNNTTLNLRIEVHDTGTGLSKSQIGRIFEKFEQADTSITRRFGGTGLGLSIAKELVSLMGGQIGVESTPGQGSCFWFEVPVGYNSDVLARAMPRVGERALMLHEQGAAAHAASSILRAVGYSSTVVHQWEAFQQALALNDHHLVVVQSDHPEAGRGLPPGVLERVGQAQCRLLVLDRDLLSADSAFLHTVPPELAHTLGHVAHPLLIQDVLATRGDPQTSLGPNAVDEAALQHLQGKHALVLEDHPVNQELILALLQHVGMRVTMQAHGQAAQAMLDQDDCPDFDVCITDLEMPVMDGFEFTEWLRDQTRWMDLPVIGLTGHAFEETRTRCMDAGMDDFMTKPVEASALYRVLLKALGVQTADDPSAAPAQPEGVNLQHLPALFLKHCANLPNALEALLIAGDTDGFTREIHSMVSLLAIMNEHRLHLRFREFEAGLKKHIIHPKDVLEEIRALWPLVVQRYAPKP
ncbi:ATP-binding protein [Limnobacter sp.]|uniref:ATP-binding protein n=1 Tax=Limnobacter sp. TaxID=2003368 RepID=UPI0035152C00